VPRPTDSHRRAPARQRSLGSYCLKRASPFDAAPTRGRPLPGRSNITAVGILSAILTVGVGLPLLAICDGVYSAMFEPLAAAPSHGSPLLSNAPVVAELVAMLLSVNAGVGLGSMAIN
jgi:hypothetical protein